MLPLFRRLLRPGTLHLFALAVVLPLFLSGRMSTAQAQPATLSDAARISMVTVLPGDAVHTEFGHSALRVRDPVRDIDWLYSYGTFDFDDPLFLPKFTYGRLTYFLSVAHSPGMMRFYERQQRPVIEQSLALTRSERQALFQFLQTNARPENRYYQYDFLFDNCSTRIRDALETVLGDRLTFAPRPNLDTSFRRLLDPYVADRPLIDVGFDLALGRPADRIATPYQTMFLPEHLLTAFAHASVAGDGRQRPLVARTDTLVWVDGYDATERAFAWPTALAWGLFGLTLAWTGWQVAQAKPPGRTADATALGLVGFAGLALCFLWFISEHTVTDMNWNLAWAWPTHLGAAIVLARGTAAHHKAVRVYLLATAGVGLLLGLGWAWWPQDLHATFQPLVLALSVRAAWHAGYASRSLQRQDAPAAVS